MAGLAAVAAKPIDIKACGGFRQLGVIACNGNRISMGTRSLKCRSLHAFCSDQVHIRNRAPMLERIAVSSSFTPAKRPLSYPGERHSERVPGFSARSMRRYISAVWRLWCRSHQGGGCRDPARWLPARPRRAWPCRSLCKSSCPKGQGLPDAPRGAEQRGIRSGTMSGNGGLGAFSGMICLRSVPKPAGVGQTIMGT